MKAILNLPWGKMSPVDLAYMSTITGTEFAESLRLGLEVFPDDEKIQQVILEELDTDNLRFEDYKESGDHVDMLNHFFGEKELWDDVSKEARGGGEAYLDTIRNDFTPLERMMTIASREMILPDVFSVILNAHDWSGFGLGFYKQYLDDHIRWDGDDGGHGDLVKHIELNPAVLKRFWEHRLKLYQSLPTNV